MVVYVYLVDDVDGILQQESSFLPLIVDVGVVGELLDFLFSSITEQHLITIETHFRSKHQRKYILKFCEKRYVKCIYIAL